MGNGYYNMVATVLLVMNFERTRSMQDFCGNCPAAFMKPVQTAQEEDACSCRFPEEEEGGCEL
uniref:TNF receptor superfamily member 9 n=1 Tax=Prolemur simus TaxID=1328070 RepID=A0A8C9AY66_PROSS